MNNIPKNIKEKRLNKGITQQEVATHLFVTRQCISRWEQGKTLPDINSIEKLSKLFGCSINDLLDDESIKSITIKEAISSKKNHKVLYISIIISIIAIAITIVGIIYSNMPDDEEREVAIATVYVIDIDADICILDFEDFHLRYDEVDDEENTVYTYNCNSMDSVVFNNQDLEISIEDLQLEDKIEVTFYKDTKEVTSMKVIDSFIEEELYGFYIAETIADISDLNDFRGDTYQTRFYYDMQGKSGYNVTMTTVDRISEDTYLMEEIDFEFTLDPLKVENEMALYAYTSNGMKFIETIDFTGYHNITIEGERYISDTHSSTLRDSKDLIYNISIKWAFTYDTITAYEYDKDNNLVNETVIPDYKEFHNFDAHDDAIRTYLEIHSIHTNGAWTWTETEVIELLLGEQVEINYCNDVGFTWLVWFKYSRTQN